MNRRRNKEPTTPSLPPGPLTGVRVLDLSRVLAGPFATQQLVDLGATVVKVEAVRGGDLTRSWGPPFVDEDRSAYFLATNRGKRSIAVDLKTAEGQEIVRQLALDARVLIENFRPGQLETWGLALPALRAANPDLVTCRISGFGTGRRASDAGYDALIQAMSGLMSITGPAAGPPSKVGVAVVDVITGLFASNAILAALLNRDPTSNRHVEVALLDSAIAALVNVASSVLLTGEDIPRPGNTHPSIVPYQVFRTSDGSFMLGVGSDRQWRILAEVLDRRDWLREEWSTNPGRVEHRVEVVRALAAEFARRRRLPLVEALTRAGVPAGLLCSVSDALQDPGVVERGQICRHRDGTSSVASPLRFDDRVAAPAEPSPRLGEHTREILRELGYDDARVARWLRRGIVAEPRPPAAGRFPRAEPPDRPTD